MTSPADSKPSSARGSSLFAKVLLRLVAGGIALLALGGPSPGYIGGCAGTAPGAPDARQYCTDKGGLVCMREFYSGRANLDQFNACVAQIVPMCAETSWGACVPNVAQTNACLVALGDSGRFAMTTPEIPECNQANWCPAGI
jgi:hypothetical protein